MFVCWEQYARDATHSCCFRFHVRIGACSTIKPLQQASTNVLVLHSTRAYTGLGHASSNLYGGVAQGIAIHRIAIHREVWAHETTTCLRILSKDDGPGWLNWTAVVLARAYGMSWRAHSVLVFINNLLVIEVTIDGELWMMTRDICNDEFVLAASKVWVDRSAWWRQICLGGIIYSLTVLALMYTSNAKAFGLSEVS